MFKKIKKVLYRSLENRDISYKKMQEMLKNDKNIILLDVRSSQEFAEDHLEGAINIPVFDLETKSKKQLPDKLQTIIIYCSTGKRSKRAKEILEQLKYEKVYQLKNGLDGVGI